MIHIRHVFDCSVVMADLQERQLAVDVVFEMYDVKGEGLLASEKIKAIHADMRIGGISMQQV